MLIKQHNNSFNANKLEDNSLLNNTQNEDEENEKLNTSFPIIIMKKQKIIAN